MWLDDCRIPFVNEISIKISGDRKHLQKWKERDGRTPRNIDEIDNTPYENTQGRFTPNLLVCDDMLNDGVITKQSKRTYKPTEHSGSLFGNSPQAHGVGIGDSGSSSRYYDLDKWFDKVIDEIQ
jgi:hypothetical protein